MTVIEEQATLPPPENHFESTQSYCIENNTIDKQKLYLTMQQFNPGKDGMVPKEFQSSS